jgi:NhaA family Na+:H+ antiporter
VENHETTFPIACIALSASPIARILGSMQQFISREASSGVVLLAMAIIALLLANSPFAGSYQALLETNIGIAIGP